LDGVKDITTKLVMLCYCSKASGPWQTPVHWLVHTTEKELTPKSQTAYNLKLL